MTGASVHVGDDLLVITVHDATGGSESVAASIELPVGAVDIGRRHLIDDPPLPEQLTNAIGEVLDHLEDAKRELPSLLNASHVTVDGPLAAVIAAVEFGGPIESSEFVLTRAAAEDVFRTLATESHVERRHNPGLPQGLVPVVVGGCCVIVAVLRGLHLDEVTVRMPT